MAVSEDEFEASKALPARYGASWAIWGEATDDLSVFDAFPPNLRKDVVLIGANPGTGGDGGDFTPFKNFHAKKSRGDSKLKNALRGTPLEGAFLTDLVKNYSSKYATGLKHAIRTGELDAQKYVAEGFRAEQEAVGLNEQTLYIPMGAKTRELWDFLVAQKVIPETQRVFHRAYGNGPGLDRGPMKPSSKVENLVHYSASVNMAGAIKALLAQPRLK